MLAPAPGSSAEPRELQALPWAGQGRSCVYKLGERKSRSNDSLCEEGGDRRGHERLDVAEGHKKSAGESPPPLPIILVLPSHTLLNHELAAQKGSKNCCGPE